jgi:predicted ABC-type ATPase
MTTVNVTVSGLTGSGKSAVYGEIVTALQAIGVPVVHADERAWRSECHMTHADWEAALDLYKPTVVIREQNVPRKLKQTWLQRLLTKALGATPPVSPNKED